VKSEKRTHLSGGGGGGSFISDSFQCPRVSPARQYVHGRLGYGRVSIMFMVTLKCQFHADLSRICFLVSILYGRNTRSAFCSRHVDLYLRRVSLRYSYYILTSAIRLCRIDQSPSQHTELGSHALNDTAESNAVGIKAHRR